MRDEIRVEWDQTEDFGAYIFTLEQIRSHLRRWRINVDDETMIAMAMKQVVQSSVFTKEHRQKYEDEVEDNEPTWNDFKAFFINKYEMEEAYADETAGRGGLQGINEMQEKQASEDDGLAEYLYEMKLAATNQNEAIQAVNNKTLSVVEAQNERIKSLTELCNSQQKTIQSQQATIATLSNSKRNTSRGGGSSGGGAVEKPKAELKKCINCGKEAQHEPAKCWELPENEGKRRKGWKSVFEGMKNPHYPNNN